MDDDTTGDLRWRQQGSWLASMPPGPVLALSSIVAFFLYLTWQIEEYEEQLHRRTQAGLWVLLLLGILALVVLAHHALFGAADGSRLAVPAGVPGWRWGQLVEGGGETDNRSGGGGGSTSPWAVAAVVALLLVLASHKSSFQMFRRPFYHK